MSVTAMPVSVFMTTPVVSVTPATSLEDVYKTFVQYRITSVPVLSPEGHPLGVLSETDLLRIGRLQPASLAGLHPLELPDEAAQQHMKTSVVTAKRDTSVAEAARLMLQFHIHHVYVIEDGRVVGVFSTDDALPAVRQQHVETLIGDLMSKPVYAVPARAELSEATARLDRTNVSGLAVLDDNNHPIGVFTKTDALKVQALPADATVDKAMSFGMVTLPANTPAFRAAAHAFETRARRVFVIENGSLAGVLTGFDFVKLLTLSE